MFSDGFTDLRMNRQRGQGEESFWPSFTDVMTVIVIIFLLAMVVVMLRNSELIRELRQTAEAERAAAALVIETAKEKEGLVVRLIDAEQKLSMTRVELLGVTEINNELKDSLSRRESELRQVSADYAASQSDLRSAHNELEQTRAQLEQAARQRDLFAEQLTDSRNKLTALQTQYKEQGEELRSVLLEAGETKHKLASLGGEYDELKIKYDKLTRPARTPRGKIVVEVRRVKVDGKSIISMKQPGEQNFNTVNEAAMHRQLQQLKAKYPKTLYVKIIFPEDSGLSYNEAWSFTNELHRKYDYYYQ